MFDAIFCVVSSFFGFVHLHAFCRTSTTIRRQQIQTYNDQKRFCN